MKSRPTSDEAFMYGASPAISPLGEGCDLVEEPITQQVERAMRTFSDFMTKDGAIGSMTIEAANAYNDLGKVLHRFIDVYHKQGSDLYAHRQRIVDLEKRLDKSTIRLTRAEAMRVAYEDEAVEHIYEYQQLDNRFDTLAQEHSIVARRNLGLDRRAREFQKAYEDLAARNRDEVQELKTALLLSETINRDLGAMVNKQRTVIAGHGLASKIPPEEYEKGPQMTATEVRERLKGVDNTYSPEQQKQKIAGASVADIAQALQDPRLKIPPQLNEIIDRIIAKNGLPAGPGEGEAGGEPGASPDPAALGAQAPQESR